MIKDANYWEEYSNYSLKKKKEKALREKRAVKKKDKERLLKQHNDAIRCVSKKYAKDMQDNPSELEKKMKTLLDNNGITYDFQRVFNIKDKDGKIIKFFIADFYVPSKNLIIETDGKFHEEQADYDKMRTLLLQYYYPNVKILRWRWDDFRSLRKLKNLLSALK